MKQITIIKKYISWYMFFPFFLILFVQVSAQVTIPSIQFQLSIATPELKNYHVKMKIQDYQEDSLILKMPKWMPGYYQIMDYAESVRDISVTNNDGTHLNPEKLNENTWLVRSAGKEVTFSYDIQTERKFVAQSYVDEEHAYIAPCNTFLYVDGMLNIPVKVSVNLPARWKNVATGLEPEQGTSNEFTAENFYILYDCPILIGNLEELPTFYIEGVPHHFVGYKIGDFDKVAFIEKLQRSIEAATRMMGDIPYKHYTFLAIGPGMGGIEHLNNTTISFDGNRLHSSEEIDNMLSFITHEYFHHYNVKRIRPMELGPFDYDRENRTTQLWVSEGLSVYYEYRILKLAELIDANKLLRFYSNEITASENDPGKVYQSLSESSYRTWDEGPFGVRGEKDTAITYYEKGPVVGLLLDFAIRNASNNRHSLDDVMRVLYQHYYKELGRGFTDAEVQQVCETLAGAKLDEVFEYIYTTKPLDYKKYLGYAGLKLIEKKEENQGKTITRYSLVEDENASPQQKTILASWLNEKKS